MHINQDQTLEIEKTHKNHDQIIEIKTKLLKSWPTYKNRDQTIEIQLNS